MGLLSGKLLIIDDFLLSCKFLQKNIRKKKRLHEEIIIWNTNDIHHLEFIL